MRTLEFNMKSKITIVAVIVVIMGLVLYGFHNNNLIASENIVVPTPTIQPTEVTPLPSPEDTPIPLDTLIPTPTIIPTPTMSFNMTDCLNNEAAKEAGEAGDSPMEKALLNQGILNEDSICSAEYEQALQQQTDQQALQQQDNEMQLEQIQMEEQIVQKEEQELPQTPQIIQYEEQQLEQLQNEAQKLE